MSTIAQIVQTLQIKLSTLSKGDLAKIRRSEYTVWGLLSQTIPEDFWSMNAERREVQERSWISLLADMASAGTGSGYDPAFSVGKILAENAYSEIRLLRLLRSHDEVLLEEIRRMSTYLTAKGASISWIEVANLVFTTSPEKSDSVRRRIARDFYSSQPV